MICFSRETIYNWIFSYISSLREKKGEWELRVALHPFFEFYIKWINFLIENIVLNPNNVDFRSSRTLSAGLASVSSPLSRLWGLPLKLFPQESPTSTPINRMGDVHRLKWLDRKLGPPNGKYPQLHIVREFLQNPLMFKPSSTIKRSLRFFT